ncbi:MAG: organomercurial lyase [Candidatus Rokuibacteriota bacterium]
MAVPIKTAAELVDAELEARWAARRAERRADVLRHVLRRFAAEGGPVPVDAVCRAFPGRAPDTVRAELRDLDEKDFLVIREDRVELAYPFSGAATAFAVILPDGGERHACCAIDALGIAPMLRRSIAIRSECHHCRASLGFTVTPAGPGPEADGIMVWVGRRAPDQRRVCTTL